MPIVSNTSPILNLAIIGHLDLLRQQFGQIQIPPAVLDELKITEERPGAQPIQVAITADWIEVQPVNTTNGPRFPVKMSLITNCIPNQNCH